MLNLSKTEIDDIRKKGYRPQIIGVCINNNRILFVYNKGYDLWMFPQGGIDNKENVEQAFWREMTEELGEAFITKLNKDLNFILKDKTIFPTSKQGSRPLRTDDGKKIHMQGKTYFTIATKSNSDALDISKTEFDDYKWCDLEESQEMIKKMYQPSKQRITKKIIDELEKRDLI